MRWKWKRILFLQSSDITRTKGGEDGAKLSFLKCYYDI